MARTLYYSVDFVTLHQKNPGFTPGNNQGNPYLKIGDIETSQRKYSLEFGFGDPGEESFRDTFDYPEFSIGFATFVRPADYGARGTYQTETSGGGTRTTSYQIWHVATVPDDYVLPADILFPQAGNVINSYLNYSVDLLFDYAKNNGINVGPLATAFNTYGLYDTLKSHMETQFGLIQDALNGKIDAQQLMMLSDQAALGFAADLAGSAVGVPGPLVEAIKAIVATQISTQNPSQDYAVAYLNHGAAAYFVPPVPTAFREVGSLQSDELYDHYTNGDVVVGGAGDDVVRGDIGSDILVGGAGSDTLDYGAVAADLDISLIRNTAISTMGGFVDQLAGFENLVGGRGSNRLEGSNASNTLSGVNGKQNSLIGLAGEDQLIGGAGKDTLDGGADFDTAIYNSGIFDPVRFTYTGLTLSLEDPSINTGQAAGDVWISIENLSGSDAGDTIIGDEAGNTLSGNLGNDQIYGRDGDDVLVGGLGADQLYGQAGIDTASYAFAASAVTANLLNPTRNGGEAAGDGYLEIENLVGSRYSDVLTGDLLNNFIGGGEGGDKLFGGDGNDVLSGGAGADRLDGGAGKDTASYASAGAGVVANLNSPSLNTAEAKGDRYSSIESLTGSKHDDILTGNKLANTISGGVGDDRINGMLGSDTLTGGAGADFFIFDSKLSPKNVDRIRDFSTRDDAVLLDDDILAQAGKVGDLSKSAFYIGGKAHDASDRIIYDSKTGKLFYDADGNGKGAAIVFAIFEQKLKLTAADFDIIA